MNLTNILQFSVKLQFNKTIRFFLRYIQNILNDSIIEKNIILNLIILNLHNDFEYNSLTGRGEG